MNKRHLQGFTLIELIITLAVFSILVVIAAPSFQGVVQNTRLSTSTNLLVGSLQLARSEAIKRNEYVSVCPSTDGNNCTSSSWSNGWIVFTDTGTSGTVDGADQLINVQQAIHDSMSVQVTSSNPYIRFTGMGRALTMAENDNLMAAINENTISTRWGKILSSISPIKSVMAETDSGSSSSSDSSSSHSTGDSHSSGSHSSSSHSTGDSHSSGSHSSDSHNTGDSHSSGSHSSDSHSTGDSHSSGSHSSSSHSTGDSHSSGSHSGGSSSSTQAQFKFCDDSKTDETGNEVHISVTGRVSLVKVQCQ